MRTVERLMWDHPFIHTMEESLKTIGRKPIIEGSYFHTDMGWVEKAGIPIINFGPGDPAQAIVMMKCVRSKI